MIKEDALDAMWMRCRHNDKTFEAYCVLKRELGLNELDGVDRVKTELEPELNELEPKYCDRNICLSNEYNGISCDECEVMKSQEPCEDAISRQAVWDVMQELWGTSGELMDRLMALPPITPAEKVGHWIDVQGLFFCSECDDGFGEVFHWNYCPNCGAKMEVEE